MSHIKSTVELDKELESGNLGNYTKYCKNNLTNVEYREFCDFISWYFKENKIKRKNALAAADLPLKYGYELLAGTKRTKSRDKIIRICVATKMDITNTNRALKLYGFSPLYSKNERDALIILCINNKNLDVDDVCEQLESNGFDTLDNSMV